MRPFEDADALALDFNTRDRVALVSKILRTVTRNAAGEPLNEEFFLRLPVGVRLHGLALLWWQSGRGQEVSLRCQADGCGSDFELSLPLAAFVQAAEERGSPETVEVTIGEGTVRARLPTCEDLLRWAEQSPSREGLVHDLLVSPACPATPPSTEEVMEAVEQALAQADPLVDAVLSGTCPACGHGFQVAIDLEQHALAALEREQETLLEAVDTLARSYHWTEAEILALPSWRRQHYLDRIANGAR